MIFTAFVILFYVICLVFSCLRYRDRRWKPIPNYGIYFSIMEGLIVENCRVLSAGFILFLTWSIALTVTHDRITAAAVFTSCYLAAAWIFHVLHFKAAAQLQRLPNPFDAHSRYIDSLEGEIRLQWFTFSLGLVTAIAQFTALLLSE